MKLKPTVAALSVLLALGGAAGCSDDDNGTLQQSWTIQGAATTTACNLVGATQMRLVVIRSDAVAEATSFVPCESFQASISLREDTYTTAATFLGVDGLAVSQTKIIPAFQINSGDTTFASIDFALTDFLPR